MVTLWVAIVMVFSSYMTSFAATGWVEEGDKWYYYDRYGTPVTNKWQSKDGVLCYLGDEGFIADNTWVEGSNGAFYYTDDSGAKVRNEWRFIYGSSNDQGKRRYYFDDTGKMATTKKLIDGETYYFTIDGEMLSGWIAVDGAEARQLEESAVGKNVYYADEETGARVSGWKELYAPEDEDWSEGPFWYHFNTDGKMRNNMRVGIDRKVYLFGEDGKRLSGWAYADLTVGAQIIADINEDTVWMFGDRKNYYYCDENGATSKEKWMNVVPAGGDAEDLGVDREWYYFDKNGQPYYAAYDSINITMNSITVADRARPEDIGKKNQFTGDTDILLGFKKIGTKTYAFDATGKRVTGLINAKWEYAPFYSAGYYYFDKKSGDAMATGSVSIIDDNAISHAYYFSLDIKNGYAKGQGITGMAAGKFIFGWLSSKG